jgi:hypothetical protein
MSVNTARMLNRIFSNTAWKLLLVMGLLAFIACFFIKGKKRTIPIVVCILSLCLYLVTAVINGRANHLINQQAGQEPVKNSDMNAQEPEEVFQVVASENKNGERDNPEIEVEIFDFDEQKTEDTVYFDEEKTDESIGQNIPESKDDTIAVIMSVSNVTPTGLTIHFRQYDKRENISLVYGDDYYLETLNGDTWEEVPRIIEERGNEEVGFINMPAEGESELEINWKKIYGKLTPGTYRITMAMMDWDQDNPSAYIPAYPLKSQFIIAGTDGIVRTYEVTDPDLSEQYYDEDKLVTITKYYEMSDGTWQANGYSYKYRLEITGRMGNAVKDSTFVYLSNIPEISFEQAWKAAGLSSNLDDYFDPEEAVLVEMK